MADPNVAKFNKELEKLSATCAADVGKLLATCRNSIISRLDKLGKDIQGLDVPNPAPPELAKLQDQMNTILKRESARFKGILTLTAAVRVNGGKISVPATGVSGPLASV